ncbi:ubiquitin family protein [Trichuris suis]|nr:ubiquitin family protein [Trichuris suis]
MKIKVKSGDGMQEYTVDDEATVGDLKDLIVERHAHPRDRICLIFSGSILKDEEALSGKGITDGITIHMVIRQVFPKAEAPAENSSEPAATDESQPRDDQNPPAQQQQQAQQQQPQNMESFLPFFMIPFQAFENLNELMQRQVEGGQEAPNLQELLENSFMRNLFNQPETIRNMLLSNPQVQRIIEQNPDLGFLLNNPELYRETMNLVRNPAAFQELMRNHDRLVSNIESMPGGMATLQRMYQEIQEPMMNATRDQFGAPNPFASLASDNQGENVSLAGRENRTPLPNPWAPRNERTAQTAPLADSSSLGSGKTDSTTSAVPQGYENVTLLETLLRNRRFREVFHRMASNGDLRKKLILSTSHEPLSDPDDTTLQERLATVFKERDELRKLGDGLQQPAVFAGLWHILQGIHILMREMPSVFDIVNDVW